jgi:hypothetical protein
MPQYTKMLTVQFALIIFVVLGCCSPMLQMYCEIHPNALVLFLTASSGRTVKPKDTAGQMHDLVFAHWFKELFE